MHPQKLFWFAVGRSRRIFEVSAPSAYAAKNIIARFIADQKNGYGWNTEYRMLPNCPVRRPRRIN